MNSLPEDPKRDEDLQDLQPAAFEAAAEMFDGSESQYPGDLITDCAAVSLSAQIRGIAADAAPAVHMDRSFHRVLGDGKNQDSERAATCGGYYETQARTGR